MATTPNIVAAPPRLPDAPAAYNQRHHDQHSNALRLYLNQVSNALTAALGPLHAPFDYVDLNPDAVYADQLGRLGWSADDQTLNIGMDYGVIQQVGQETYARVQNSTGVSIPNGTVVGFVGVGVDNTLRVAPYLADGATPTLYVLGVMTHLLPDSGEKGYCTVWGHVRDLDTTGATYGETWALGDILYASPTTAGGLTNIKPTAPSNVIPMAAVLEVSATEGEIFVRPTIQQMQHYGIFDKTSSQTPAAIDTEYLLTFDTTRLSNGVVRGAPTSRIVVPESGLYQFDANLQLTSSSASSKNIWVWFKKNGVAIANSARLVTSDLNGGYIPLSIRETVSLSAGEYVELAFASSDTAVTIGSVAATAFAPAAPAIVLNVTQVQQ